MGMRLAWHDHDAKRERARSGQSFEPATEILDRVEAGG
jgi:hypothetical protein